MIIADSREQTNQHILKYFERHEIPYTVHKLDVGDYAMEGNDAVRVERKKNLSELAHNLLSADRARFYREIRRAREQGIKLIILCEHGPKIKTIRDVENWKNPYGKVTGKNLADAIFRCAISYNVPFHFCSKASTGRIIVRLLTQREEYNDKERK